MHLLRFVHDLTYHIFLHPLSLYNTFVLMYVSQHISYKTLKVYLAGIRLLNIEHGLPDPTDDSLLELVCRRIRRQQGDHQRTRLPITINQLRTLKNQLRVSQYSLLEQRMLWASFTLAFYGFLRISEYTVQLSLNLTLVCSKHVCI